MNYKCPIKMSFLRNIGNTSINTISDMKKLLKIEIDQNLVRTQPFDSKFVIN